MVKNGHKTLLLVSNDGMLDMNSCYSEKFVTCFKRLDAGHELLLLERLRWIRRYPNTIACRPCKSVNFGPLI